MNRSASSARIGVGPAEPTHAATARRLRPDRQRERADRDHHRVAGADLGELLRAIGRGDVEGRDQLVVGEAVRFGPVTNSLTPRRRVPAPRRELYLGVGREQRRQPVAGRRRGTEVAADRPAVADLGRPHRARRDRQPGQAVAELGDQPRIRDAGPDAQVTVLGSPLDSSGIRVRSRIVARADPVEVELDHQVGAAGDRNRVRVRGFELERLLPAVGLQNLHGASSPMAS